MHRGRRLPRGVLHGSSTAETGGSGSSGTAGCRAGIDSTWGTGAGSSVVLGVSEIGVASSVTWSGGNSSVVADGTTTVANSTGNSIRDGTLARGVAGLEGKTIVAAGEERRATSGRITDYPAVVVSISGGRLNVVALCVGESKGNGSALIVVQDSVGASVSLGVGYGKDRRSRSLVCVVGSSSCKRSDTQVARFFTTWAALASVCSWSVKASLAARRSSANGVVLAGVEGLEKLSTVLAESGGASGSVGSDELAGNRRAEDEEGCNLNHCAEVCVFERR